MQHTLADYVEVSNELYRLRLEKFVLKHGGNLVEMAVEPPRKPGNAKGVNSRVHDPARYMAMRAEAASLRQERYQ